MARNFYQIFTENNPVMGDSKTFGIPEAKGLMLSVLCEYVGPINIKTKLQSWIKWHQGKHVVWSCNFALQFMFEISVKVFLNKSSVANIWRLQTQKPLSPPDIFLF